MSRPVITLTTDFGLADAYVAAMKGVILSICHDVQIVDISHEVAPQNVFEAGYLLESVVSYFPSGTVHVVVVDPGVGTDRRPLAVDTGAVRFVAPDNGVLTAPLTDLNVLGPEPGELTDAKAVEIRSPGVVSGTISSTFHGRDIFAPAAAHLVSGANLAELGPMVSRIELLPQVAPEARDGEIRGRVVHVDHFGNLITNIPGRSVSVDAQVSVAGRVLYGLSQNYQERDLAVLIGSGGYVEIAVRNGSAASALDLHVGAPVTVRGSA